MEFNSNDFVRKAELRRTLEFDPRFPPGEITDLLISAGRNRIRERRKNKMHCNVIAELGAKDGFAGLVLAPECQRLIATDVVANRIELIKRNFLTAGLQECDVFGAMAGDWFPPAADLHSVDVFLVNPPSIPEAQAATTEISKDEFVYFAGPDGRRYIRQIVYQASSVLGKHSELIVVGADYVLDDWLIRECFENSLQAIPVIRERVFSPREGIDCLISKHVQANLGWTKFEETSDGIFFEKVAYSVFLKSK